MRDIGPKIGLLLTRFIVPGWVFAGALFKLTEASPGNLPPKTILTLGYQAGINLHVLLATLVGVEFLAVAIMLMVARLARPVAIFMLSVFCLVLIGEMVQGNVTSCGCLGKVAMPPWLMLAVDGTLFLGVLAFDPASLYRASAPRWPVVAALIAAAGGFYWSFVSILPAFREPATGEPQATLNTNGGPTGSGGNAGTGAPEVPPYWLFSDVEEWVGEPWRDVKLFSFVAPAPTGLDGPGTRYVAFYNRTCDHCEEMFIEDLTDPALARMVTAVEVPDGRDRMTSPSAWIMPVTEVEHRQLPLGCEWIITTPLVITVTDGVVTCAEEGDHRKCMGME